MASASNSVAKREIERPIMRTYLFVILTSVLVSILQEPTQAQAVVSPQSLLLDNLTIDIGPLIGQATAQSFNPATRTTGRPIIPNSAEINNEPSPAPANESLPSSTKNVAEEVNQKFWRLAFTFGTGV